MITIPLIVMIAGLLLYFLVTDGRVQETGRIMFAFGLLVVLLGYGAKALL